MVKHTRLTTSLILLAITLSFSAWPAPVTFNDSALLSAVTSQWEAATGLTLSNPPEDTELANPLFTTLMAKGLDITDLTGLEACSSLTDLNLGLNQISDLTPLSGLTNLVSLDLGFGCNPITCGLDDPFITGTNLITDISPLATLVNLEYLNLMGNDGLTNIAAISSMDSLTDLWLASNPLDSFSPLLDVADTLLLFAELYCGVENADIPVFNALTNIQTFGIMAEANVTDISGLTAINPTMLALMFDQISNIDVITNYSNVQMLMIQQCPITTLPDCSGLTSLQDAGFGQNQLTDISGLSGAASIQNLDLRENQLTDISALASCTALKNIELRGNQLTDIQPLLDNSNAPNFQQISLSDNPFIEGTPFCDENQLDQLQALAPSAQIESNAICGPAFNLTISINGAGTTSPEPGVVQVLQNTYQWVNAYPIAGSGQAFSHWSGDISSTDFGVNVFMDGDKSITANFSPGDWALTINKTGVSNGEVWPEPGIYSYFNGQTANVNIQQKSGAYFNGWSGAATGYFPEVQVLMDADKTLTADFISSGYQLTLHVQGDGNIEGFYGSQPYNYAAGAEFDLEARTFSSTYRFDHWEGDIPTGADPSEPLLPVVMDQDRELTAVFIQDAKTLTLIIEGGGSTNPAGSPSPGTQYDYGTGQMVCIYAVPSEGIAFDHWSGNIGGSDPYSQSICVTMDQDRTLTAHFVAAAWNLALQVTGNGTTYPVPGVYGYVNGTTAHVSYQLIAGGDAFEQWTGDIDSGQAQNTWVSVSMDRNRTVTANFVPGDWTLTINRSGPGSGGINPEPGVYAYLDGQTASMNAFTNPSAYFAGWTGDVEDDTPNISITMDSNKSVTANFSATGYMLTSNTQGQGNLNVYGTQYFASGTEPVLQASAWGGWVFSEWTGDVPAGADPNNPGLPVLMDQDRSITAVFVPDYKTLTIIIDGPGSTEPAGGSSPGIQHDYTSGSHICVEALLQADVAFDHWSGDNEGDSTSMRICLTMDRDRTITAHFVEADWNLTLVASGNGTTNPAPGIYGYVNGADASFGYALLDGGDAFEQWTGDIEAYNPDEQWLHLPMNKNRTVTAHFVPGDWTLTLNKSGDPDGGTSPEPGAYAYLDGQTANLYANANPSAYFAGWTGDVTDDMTSVSVAMDSDKTVTANFSGTGFSLTTNREGDGWINLWGTSYFASGMEPVLRAVSQNGWEFDHWSGDLPSGADAGNPELPVLMDQDRSITAAFTIEQKTLTVIIEGQGSTDPAGGPDPGISYDYTAGTQAWVSAALGTDGWAFSHWSGDIGSADPYRFYVSLTMDRDRTVVANYVTADWTMTLSYTGNGSTWPSPGTYGYVDGAPVEAVANIMNGGDAFDHWEGTVEGADIYDSGQRFNIHADMVLTAVFTPGDYTLTTTVTGGGIAEYVSHPSGVYQYLSGRTAKLEVRPLHDTYWGGYSGDVTTFDYACSLVMDTDKNVTITLGTSGYELVVNQTGGGLTDPSGAWKFVAGAMPPVHAIDSGSSLFDYWSGELPGGVDPYDRDPVILMDQHRTIVANFVEAEWYLYIQAIGNGTTDPVPDLYWYRDGDSFSVTATPGTDAMFLHWQGDLPEGQDPNATTLSGTMTQNREIIAVFVPMTVTVPNLYGKTEEQAAATLAVLGLVLGTITEEYSATVPMGQIISQDPVAESVVPYGSQVAVVISLGPCYTEVPNLAGLTQAEAEAALAAAKLTLGTVAEETSEEVPAGQVIRQLPVFGLNVACGTAVNIVLSLGAGGEGGEAHHTADQDLNYLINLSELLRVIQFYNSEGLHCQAGTEDGYAPGPGDASCTAHDSDYNPQDWLINLSELLRLIQFFNSGGYHPCEGSEDGFCPGP